MYERQNDPQALTYLKAHIYRESKKRQISVAIIAISVALFLAGIFNRYLPSIANDNSQHILDLQNNLSQIVNIISGVFLISQIFINTVALQANRDSSCLLSLYECFVYDITPNKSMLVQYTQNDIEAFARKIKKKPEQYLNYLFKTPEEATGRFAAFEKQYNIVNDQYRLMNYSKNFFMILWIGFIALVIALAISFDDKFISTMNNMLIPSLSIINIIARSSHSFTESGNRLRNAISTMDKKRENCKKSWSAEQQNEFLLEAEKFNQDTVFMLRLLEFTVPHFLEKRSKNYYSNPIHAAVGKISQESKTDLVQNGSPAQTPAKKETATVKSQTAKTNGTVVNKTSGVNPSAVKTDTGKATATGNKANETNAKKETATGKSDKSKGAAKTSGADVKKESAAVKTEGGKEIPAKSAKK